MRGQMGGASMDVVGDILSTMESAAAAIRMPDAELAVAEAYSAVLTLMEKNYGWANTGLFRQKQGVVANRFIIRKYLENCGVTDDLEMIEAVKRLAHALSGGNGLSERAVKRSRRSPFRLCLKRRVLAALLSP